MNYISPLCIVLYWNLICAKQFPLWAPKTPRLPSVATGTMSIGMLPSLLFFFIFLYPYDSVMVIESHNRIHNMEPRDIDSMMYWLAEAKPEILTFCKFINRNWVLFVVRTNSCMNRSFLPVRLTFSKCSWVKS